MNDHLDPAVLRRIPRTDDLLRTPSLAAAAEHLGQPLVKQAVQAAQQRARRGELPPEDVEAEAVRLLPRRASSLVEVLNATGIVVHTNIGRAPLSPAAVEAVAAAAGTVDLEMSLQTGRRSRRGEAVERALLAAVPAAEAALVVNNGAAALVLATTALAAGREVVVSRGELVEIGAGFRLPDLIASTGARLREVGTTNRTHPADHREALGADTGCLLKVHPSNFRVEGFTGQVAAGDLAAIARDAGVPLVVDTGSGLLRHDPSLPDEPDATTALEQGADLVTCSGDKLLGGPQAGLVLGRADLVERLRRHPLARALRVDKLTLAALEATLRGPEAPVTTALHTGADALLARSRALAVRLADVGLACDVVTCEGRVGGGGAPGVPLPGWALALPDTRRPDDWALALRTGAPAVLARVDEGRCLVDLRCIPADREDDLVAALVEVAGAPAGSRTTTSQERPR